MDPFQVGRFGDGLEVGLAKRDIHRRELRIALGLYQNGGDGLLRKNQLMSAGSGLQHFQDIRRRGKIHKDFE